MVLSLWPIHLMTIARMLTKWLMISLHTYNCCSIPAVMKLRFGCLLLACIYNCCSVLGHVTTICDFPSWLSMRKVNGKSWIYLTCDSLNRGKRGRKIPHLAIGCCSWGENYLLYIALYTYVDVSLMHRIR